MGQINYRLYIKNKDSVKDENKNIFEDLDFSGTSKRLIDACLARSSESGQLDCLFFVNRLRGGCVEQEHYNPTLKLEFNAGCDGKLTVDYCFRNGKEVNDFCKKTLPIFKKYGKFLNESSVSKIQAEILDRIPSRWAKFWVKLRGGDKDKARGKRYLWNLSDDRVFDSVTGSFSVDLKK